MMEQLRGCSWRPWLINGGMSVHVLVPEWGSRQSRMVEIGERKEKQKEKDNRRKYRKRQRIISLLPIMILFDRYLWWLWTINLEAEREERGTRKGTLKIREREREREERESERGSRKQKEERMHCIIGADYDSFIQWIFIDFQRGGAW